MPSVIPTHYESPANKYPFPSPFLLSSVERDWCRQDPNRIVYIKRRHLEENLKTFEREIGMDEVKRKEFLDYYCQPGDRNPSEILAEKSGYFDLRYRATKWVDKNKKTDQKSQSKIEQYIQPSQNFNALVNELFSPNVNGAGNGPANTPDEQ